VRRGIFILRMHAIRRGSRALTRMATSQRFKPQLPARLRSCWARQQPNWAATSLPARFLFSFISVQIFQ
jgi:hypothetical protein